jgi:hypothetical protein
MAGIVSLAFALLQLQRAASQFLYHESRRVQTGLVGWSGLDRSQVGEG